MTKTDSKTEKRRRAYFKMAKLIGVAALTLQLFRNGGYVAQEKQLQFHAACRECDKPNGPTQVGFGGARGPGKSHGLFAQVALDDCQRFSGLKVLYLRKVGKNAREQFEDLRRKVLAHVRHRYKLAPIPMIVFPNDSRIIVGHFKNESDIGAYLGLEYDIIVVEEATTLTLTKYKALRDSNRTSRDDGFRPRIYASTNPGGVGHAWFKSRFIKPAREKKETDTRFIFATIDDNKHLDEDYVKKLEENTGWKLAAHRYGDWDIAAGQYFTTWRYELHTFDSDAVKIIPGATVWASLDYGFNHYTTCYLLMKHDGKTYVMDEFAERRWQIRDVAEGIKAMLQRHGLTVDQLSQFVAGHDCFAAKGVGVQETGHTIADAYAQCGIYIQKANVDRVNGAARLTRMLGDMDRKDANGKPLPSIEPTIAISRRCGRLIECIPSLEHDPKRPEDVLKNDMDEEGNGGDDPYDGLRYGVMASTGPIALI